MSGSINKVTLIGNLTRDPESLIRHSKEPMVKISLATNENWTDNESKPQEHTEWHEVLTFDNLATNCKEYLSKGRQVYVEGKLRTKKWVDVNKEISSTQIIANKVLFLGGGKKDSENGDTK